MNKIIVLIIIILNFFIVNFSFAAGSSGSSGNGNSSVSKTKSQYEYASSIIKKAKKLEEKGKVKKAKKKYKRALKYLQKSNKKKPGNPDTLNYLGFALRKLGEFGEAEKYYLEGLNIKPDHPGINEYLGELYIQTNRIELAKERLAVLKNCNCEEYQELKELIEKN